jgi:signal peptidase I
MRRAGLLLGAALTLAALVSRLAPVLERLARSWPHRIEVGGHSMEPTLLDGDWLLVDPVAFQGRGPIPAELVVFRDPREHQRLLIKRVTSVDRDGNLVVAGDHPGHRQDPATIGEVAPRLLVGRPWLVYWPIERIGRLR